MWCTVSVSGLMWSSKVFFPLTIDIFFLNKYIYIYICCMPIQVCYAAGKAGPPS